MFTGLWGCIVGLLAACLGLIGALFGVDFFGFGLVCCCGLG